jgi:hypothetical protein
MLSCDHSDKLILVSDLCSRSLIISIPVGTCLSDPGVLGAEPAVVPDTGGVRRRRGTADEDNWVLSPRRDRVGESLLFMTMAGTAMAVVVH